MKCDFCSVPASGYSLSTRPVSQVIDEIRSLSGKRFTFSDVNLLNDSECAVELLEALITLKKEWGALVNISVGEDGELLELLERASCQYLLVGMESVSDASLSSINKSTYNNVKKYRKSIEAFHRHGIVIPPAGNQDQKIIKSLSAALTPSPKMAQELAKIQDLSAKTSIIWPNLKILSCWGGKLSSQWLNEWNKCFPETKIQEKGLIATEYIGSFPIGKTGKKTLAVNSHLFEFKDIDSGKYFLAHELEDGKRYSIIVTTGICYACS